MYNKISKEMTDYMKVLESTNELCVQEVAQEKITEEKFYIPSITNYTDLLKYNYTIPQLKLIAKSYKIKTAGNKSELLLRAFTYARMSYFVQKIQKIVRGNIQRQYNSAHGPGFLKKKLCTNETDFFTMEPITELPTSQFFSYMDVDGFIYGFDIISLYNLILKSGSNVKNPYNRMDIQPTVIQNIRTLIRLSKVLRIPIEINIKDANINLSSKKSLELRILDLFQNIDALGNYSKPEWFSNLTRSQLYKFMRELMDIWNYRVQLTIDTKRAICPPNGDPFRNVSLNYIQIENNMDEIRKNILNILEKFVNTGIDRDSKALGAYYVLAALTLVNDQAAEALPWLYQSVSY